jgi:hypothetical protein
MHFLTPNKQLCPQMHVKNASIAPLFPRKKVSISLEGPEKGNPGASERMVFKPTPPRETGHKTNPPLFADYSRAVEHNDCRGSLASNRVFQAPGNPKTHPGFSRFD